MKTMNNMKVSRITESFWVKWIKRCNHHLHSDIILNAFIAWQLPQRNVKKSRNIRIKAVLLFSKTYSSSSNAKSDYGSQEGFLWILSRNQALPNKIKFSGLFLLWSRGDECIWYEIDNLNSSCKRKCIFTLRNRGIFWKLPVKPKILEYVKQ